LQNLIYYDNVSIYLLLKVHNMAENQSEKAQEKAITKEANAIVSTLKEDGKITGPLTPEIEARARKLAEGLKD
jgi:hypothetical protein